jgi:SAM-dependent methyltransferase
MRTAQTDAMNRIHHAYCRSERWRSTLRERLLPWALGGVELGAEPLELGPGPGLTTELLAGPGVRWTCVEIDPALARPLAARLRERPVRVVEGDATRLPFAAGSFSGAVALTMLHHVPSAALQDRLLREVHRVLRGGAVFAGSDSTTSLLFRLVHLGDTLVPVEPGGFRRRLEAAGFRDVRVDVARRAFRFRARAAS